MPYRFRTLANVALVLLTFAVASPPWASAEESVVPGKGTPGILDEYNADLSIGGDLQRLAVGINFGDVKKSGFWWNYGARLGSAWFDNGKADEQGFTLGGVVGLGYDPYKKVSPVAGLALDFALGMGPVDFVTQVHTGARIRLNDDPEHFTLTVAAFWSGLFLGDGLADDTDVGVAVLFSAASLRPR